MRKITITLIAGVATLAVAGSAWAQGRAAPDGDLTRTAVQQRAAEGFAKMDVNGDGKLDGADREAQLKARFDQMDSDKNGQLSFEEMKAMRDMRPEGMGGQRPGERGDRMGRPMRPPMAMRGPGGPEMRGMPRPAMGPRGLGESADTNADKAISQAEFEAAQLAHFDALDGDKDGTVTSAERKAHRDAMRAQMKERRDQMREQMKARRAEPAG